MCTFTFLAPVGAFSLGAVDKYINALKVGVYKTHQNAHHAHHEIKSIVNRHAGISISSDIKPYHVLTLSHNNTPSQRSDNNRQFFILKICTIIQFFPIVVHKYYYVLNVHVNNATVHIFDTACSRIFRTHVLSIYFHSLFYMPTA